LLSISSWSCARSSAVSCNGYAELGGRVALRGAGPGLRGLDLAVLWRRARLEGVQQLARCRCHGVDGVLERLRVRPRRLVEAADLAHVLERRAAHLVLGGGRLEVVEGPDVSAHAAEPSDGARSDGTHTSGCA